jgi:hypothetical protein
MLHAIIQPTASYRSALTLKMDGDWEERSPIVITRDPDDDDAFDEERLRYWLNHIATGMFGHMVSSDTLAAPADVYHALVTTKEWDVTIQHADKREVRLDLPPGAVH